MDLFLSQSSSALGKITTLQKLCPLIDPQRDSLWCLVTRNKPGLTFYRSCHEFYWNWCSAGKHCSAPLSVESLSITAHSLCSSYNMRLKGSGSLTPLWQTLFSLCSDVMNETRGYYHQIRYFNSGLFIIFWFCLGYGVLGVWALSLGYYTQYQNVVLIQLQIRLCDIPVLLSLTFFFFFFCGAQRPYI